MKERIPFTRQAQSQRGSPNTALLCYLCSCLLAKPISVRLALAKSIFMEKNSFLIFLLLLSAATACGVRQHPAWAFGRHYQRHTDSASLAGALAAIPVGTPKARVAQLLGEPIDMGFDYRYLLDSVGPAGCVVGAVFHINDEGLVDDKWIGEICE